MRVFTSNRGALNQRLLAVSLFVLFLAVLAQAQRPTSPWYLPGINMTKTERGDFQELKDKHRVFVSFFHGSTPTAYQRTLEQQVFQQLKQYHGLAKVENPQLADLAIHIRVAPIHSAAVDRMPIAATDGPAPIRRNDITFYVLTRGTKHGEDIYNPRVIVRRQRMDTETSTSALVLELGSFIDRLKRLQGEK